MGSGSSIDGSQTGKQALDKFIGVEGGAGQGLLGDWGGVVALQVLLNGCTLICHAISRRHGVLQGLLHWQAFVIELENMRVVFDAIQRWTGGQAKHSLDAGNAENTVPRL